MATTGWIEVEKPQWVIVDLKPKGLATPREKSNE
jgi:hypothetical protein